MDDLRKQTDMAERTCTHPDGCRNPHYALGWCSLHYQRWRNTGDPGPVNSTVIPDMEERFLSHVRKEPVPDGCWVWTGSVNRDSYGEFGNGQGKVVGSHRWAYEHFEKPVPDGLELDHLCHTRERLTCPGGRKCRHRRCCNPAHLSPVTKLENAGRGVNSKYTDEAYLVLYARWKAGEGQVALALESGISQSQLSRAFTRITAVISKEAS